jgi:hypothetical protein
VPFDNTVVVLHHLLLYIILTDRGDECATAADMYQCSKEEAPKAFAAIFEQKSGSSSPVKLSNLKFMFD